MKVGLVSCASQKLSQPAKACDLYTSQLFRAAWGYAKATCDEAAVLSAKHGLLLQDQVVAPYDQAMAQVRGKARAVWGAAVAAAIRARWPGPRLILTVLAGRDYADPLLAALEADGGPPVTFDEPLYGLEVGQRLQFFKLAREQGDDVARWWAEHGVLPAGLAGPALLTPHWWLR